MGGLNKSGGGTEVCLETDVIHPNDVFRNWIQETAVELYSHKSWIKYFSKDIKFNNLEKVKYFTSMQINISYANASFVHYCCSVQLYGTLPYS